MALDNTYNQRQKYIADPDTGNSAQLDDMTSALLVIENGHHEAHEGDAFTAEVHTASGTAVSFAFKTPAGSKLAHMLLSFASEGKSHVQVLKGATWTTNTGTVYEPPNQHHGSLNTSMLLEDKTTTPDFVAGAILTNPTGISGGDVMLEHYSFAAFQFGGGGGSRDHEMILAPDTTYAIVLTSDDGSKGLQLRLNWYEHTSLV